MDISKAQAGAPVWWHKVAGNAYRAARVPAEYLGPTKKGKAKVVIRVTDGPLKGQLRRVEPENLDPRVLQ